MAPRRRTSPKIERGYLGARGRKGFERLRPRGGGQYNSWLEVPDKIRNRINLAARQGAAAVMNGLAERGPRYSGDFINNWKAISLTGTGATGNASYPYQTSDIPKLKTTATSMNTVKVFSIFNTSEYAAEAMDLIPGKWRKPHGSPLGGIDYSKKVPGGVLVGERGYGPSFRWDINPSKDGSGVSTAEKDWYENYVRGGELSKDFKKGLEFQQGRGK